MYSYKHFGPGTSTKCSKLIHYVAQVNMYSDNQKIRTCSYSQNDIYKFSTQENSGNQSSKQRMSNTIKNTIGGKTVFGNFYLGKPVVANYLGRYEGQPGGSGLPPRNRF